MSEFDAGYVCFASDTASRAAPCFRVRNLTFWVERLGSAKSGRFRTFILRHILMKSFVPVAAVLSILALAALAYFFMPSVFAVRAGSGVTVNCALLGEYPSDINRVEVVERESGRMVWQVTAREEIFQLRSFDLVPGLNAGSLQPSWGAPQTDIPTPGAFELQRGVDYRASVCFANWLKICRSVDFSF